jgi:hypothetical protein
VCTSQEAVERAVAADTAGQKERAVSIYRKALEIIYEGLKVPAPVSGLGPIADNVASWKQRLNGWQLNVIDRYAALTIS